MTDRLAPGVMVSVGVTVLVGGTVESGVAVRGGGDPPDKPSE